MPQPETLNAAAQAQHINKEMNILKGSVAFNFIIVNLKTRTQSMALHTVGAKEMLILSVSFNTFRNDLGERL